MKESYEKKFHLAMCLVGGIWGGYTIVMFANTMAAAITTNLSVMVIEFLRMDMTQFLQRLGVVLLYWLGLAISPILDHRIGLNRHRCALIVVLICSFLELVMPESASATIRMYPIFFGSGCMYNSCIGYGGMGVACIFSTNNSRQAIDRMLKYKYTKDPEMKRTGIIYITCISFFTIGNIAAFFAWKLSGAYAVLFALIPLAAAALFQSKLEKAA